jgi:16S rRNA (guanine527-N7)-methyltransferase
VSTPLGPAGFAEIVPVSRETLARLEAYAALLVQWSARINLVGRDTLPDLWRRHFLDAAQLHALIPQTAAGLVDLGSGAGFPGLVLAILGMPNLKLVELVEADAKKCAFLREAARITKTGVAIRHARIETVPSHPVDVVTARALAPLDRLLPYAARFLGPASRCLFLKGERVAEELTRARQDWTMNAVLHPSRSDPRGVVLELQQVDREPRRS